MTTDNNVRVGCYVRVSTENQLENYSIETQTERLAAYCKAKDWKNPKHYTDAGFSGGNVNRPALISLLEDIDNGKINTVVVCKLDRLSRSQKDTLTLIEDEFIPKGADFISISENFDTSTPFGRAMIGLLSVFAQLEKDQITERFTMGRIARSKAGYYHGGSTAPTGYDYVNGLLVINEIKAAQVKEVFSRFLSGHSINSIRRYVSEKYGGWTSHAVVINVLRNSVYIGKVKFKGEEYDGVHEPLIDKETFHIVQKLITSSEREDGKNSAQKTPFRASYMLSSLLYCEKCGAKYSAAHGFYKCYSGSKSSKNRIIDKNCKNENWIIEELNQLVIEEIKKIRHNPGNMNLLLEKHKSNNNNNNNNIPTTIAKIKTIDSKINKLLELYQIDNAPFEQISAKITTLQNEKDTLNRVMANAPKEDALSKKDFIKKIETFDKVFTLGSTEEKRMFISYLIKAIAINENNISIHWRI